MLANLQLTNDVWVQLHVHDVDQVKYAYAMEGMKPSHMLVYKALLKLTPRHNNENDYKIQECLIL